MSQMIAITPGEPAGIGPDLALMHAVHANNSDCIYFADPELLEQRARQLSLAVNINTINTFADADTDNAATLNVFPVKLDQPAEAGKLNPLNAPYVLDTIRLAVESQLEGNTAALMTGPIHKGVINDAGIPFTGHTEYLAQLAGGTPVMMLAAEAERLRVALATTHLPLSKVSQSITQESLQHIIEILHHDLQTKYGIAQPHILVCGLNPHAGEDGHLGTEEIEIISPVLDMLRSKGYNLEGPLPADTLFTPRYLDGADAVLAMYHDQGLPVLKHVGFGHAINITLGLPIIRTSVDHGTALPLAGSGKLETGSYQAALDSARLLAKKSRGVR